MRAASAGAILGCVAVASAMERRLLASPSRFAVPDPVRLQVLPDASGDSLGGFVASSVAGGATVHTDGWRGYAGLASAGFDHRRHKQRTDHRVDGKRIVDPDRQFVLPRAHRAISNLKTWLHGTHRGVSPAHLQVYLDEFRLPPQPPRYVGGVLTRPSPPLAGSLAASRCSSSGSRGS
jgi:hypothetical protein